MRRRQPKAPGSAGGDQVPPPELLDRHAFFRPDETIKSDRLQSGHDATEQAWSLRAAAAQRRRRDALHEWAAEHLDGWGRDPARDQRRLREIVKAATAAASG